MPNFFCSIIDPSTNLPAISASGGVIQIKDFSNYSLSTEPGNSQSDFSLFRKIKFVNPDNSSYLLSSLGDGNALTIPAATAALPIVDNYTTTQGDGVYSVTLYTLPTWNNHAGYNILTTPYVYWNGVIYQAIANSLTNDPQYSPTKWAVVTYVDSLPSKYRVEVPFYVVCNLQTCLVNKTLVANCGNSSCNFSALPKDKNYSDIIILEKILISLPYLANAGMWSSIMNLINMGKEICCCSK